MRIVSRPGRVLALLVAPVAVGLVAGPALAAWTTPGSGTGAARSAGLGTGATPSAPATGSSTSPTVTVTWAASAAATGYAVRRYKGGVMDPVTVSAGCAGTRTALTCTDTVPGSGAYSYAVTPVAGTSWVGTEGARSGTRTVTLTPPTVSIGVANLTYDKGNSGSGGWQASAQGCNGALCGTVAASGSSALSSFTVRLSRAVAGTTTYWTGSAWTSSAQDVAAGSVTSTAPPAWTSAVSFANLRSASGSGAPNVSGTATYTITATATDSAAQVTTTTSTFTTT